MTEVRSDVKPDDIKEEKSGPVIEIKGKTGGSATKPRSIRKKTPLKSPNKTPKRNSTQLKKTIQQPVLVNLPVSSAVSMKAFLMSM